MDPNPQHPEFVEKIGRFFLFRAVVYLLPVMYAIRLILMVVTPEAYHMPGWQIVLWQGTRDASVVLNLVFWQKYLANYIARRTSLTSRRRDAWELPFFSCLYFSLEFPSLLELPWSLVTLTSLILGSAFYIWEMREIKRLEQPGNEGERRGRQVGHP